MKRKAFLYGFVILLVVILTACGPVQAPAQGGAQDSGASGALGSPLGLFLGLAFVALIAFILIKAGTGSKTRNTTPDRPAEKKPIQKPVEPAVLEESSTPKVVTSGHIFISYRRSDSADITGRIYDRLIGKFGRNPIFKDVDSIPLGFDFKEYLDAKVSECSVLLAIIGDRWLEASDENTQSRLNDPTDFVRIEIESALARGIPVIPLLVRGAHMPAEAKLPASLKKLVYRNGIPIRSDPDFHRDMDRLIASLEKYIQA